MNRFLRTTITATAGFAAISMAAPAVASPFLPPDSGNNGPSDISNGDQDPDPDPEEPSTNGTLVAPEPGPDDPPASDDLAAPQPEPDNPSPSDDLVAPTPEPEPVDDLVAPTPEPKPVDELATPGKPKPRPGVTPGSADKAAGSGCAVQCITKAWVDAPSSSDVPVVTTHVRTSVPATIKVVFSRTAPVTVDGHTWLTDIEHTIGTEFTTMFDKQVEGLEPGVTWYAAVEAVDKHGNISYRSGSFETPRRRVLVQFSKISVIDDGDSGLRGSGELRFRFFADNQWHAWTPEVELDSGDTLTGPGGTALTNGVFLIDDAPRIMVLGAHAMERDGNPSKSKCLIEAGESYPLNGSWRCRQFAGTLQAWDLDAQGPNAALPQIWVEAHSLNLHFVAHGSFTTTYVT